MKSEQSNCFSEEAQTQINLHILTKLYFTLPDNFDNACLANENFGLYGDSGGGATSLYNHRGEKFKKWEANRQKTETLKKTFEKLKN